MHANDAGKSTQTNHIHIVVIVALDPANERIATHNIYHFVIYYTVLYTDIRK